MEDRAEGGWEEDGCAGDGWEEAGCVGGGRDGVVTWVWSGIGLGAGHIADKSSAASESDLARGFGGCCAKYVRRRRSCPGTPRCACACLTQTWRAPHRAPHQPHSSFNNPYPAAPSTSCIPPLTLRHSPTLSGIPPAPSPAPAHRA